MVVIICSNWSLLFPIAYHRVELVAVPYYGAIMSFIPGLHTLIPHHPVPCGSSVDYLYHFSEFVHSQVADQEIVHAEAVRADRYHAVAASFFTDSVAVKSLSLYFFAEPFLALAGDFALQ